VRELAEGLGFQVPENLGFWPGMGLPAALAQFGFLVSLLQSPEALERVASECCEDALAEGVSTLELRFAPQLHGASSLMGPVEAVMSGLQGRAGLLLCALYGDPPALVEALVDTALACPGVVGVDLAGGPAPQHTWRMKDYASPFQRAAAGGLGVTIHAGEGRSPQEILVAIDALHAHRIGHGTTLLAEPAVLERVLSAEVVIEACLSSNHHVGAIATLEDHPLVQWMEAGVRVCLNTDNTLLSRTTAPGEHALAVAHLGLDTVQSSRLVETGHAAAFSR
jgi:adenosine deaminase